MLSWGAMQIWIQRSFAPLKKWLPTPLSATIRAFVTAAIGPAWNARRWGHTRSSFASKAVSKEGAPLPWYTYPCIHFLAAQSFAGMRVLEFGAGQSTLWWAARASSVVAFEADLSWLRRIEEKAPSNVILHALDDRSPEQCRAQVQEIVDPILGDGFDLVIVDGSHRNEIAKLGTGLLAPNGALICDNAEGFGIFDALRSSGLMRVDFYGMAPGIILSHCTSIFFRPSCPLFGNCRPIPSEWALSDIL